MSGWLVLANGVALIAAVAWLAALVLPVSRAVRVRNTFLLRRGTDRDFVWTPEQVPDGFRVEYGALPPAIATAMTKTGTSAIAGDWPKALALVDMLVRHARDEGPIQADLVSTLEGIVGGGGYCADYVRVFLATAHGAGLFCRQWAFSFDGFGGHGHTFVEIYDRQRQAWVFLDVYNNVYAARAEAPAPIDALALRKALAESTGSITFCRASPGRLGFPDVEKLLAYYTRGTTQWYLWWGNDVISRELRLPMQLIGRFSGALAHRAGSVLGGLPPLVVIPMPDNEPHIRRMEKLRLRVTVAAAVVAVLSVLFGAQVLFGCFEQRDG